MKLAPSFDLPIANFHVDDFILLNFSDSRLINSRELFKGLDCFALRFFNCSAVVGRGGSASCRVTDFLSEPARFESRVDPRLFSAESVSILMGRWAFSL